MAEYLYDVLVDMGHNTGYNRSPVVPGYYEGNQMWILGELLIEELRALGRTVKTTKRSRDEDPGVTTRGRMAAGCKIAVSEHSNAGGLGKTDRAVGICLVDDDCGPIDEISQELARRLAEADTKIMGLKDAAQVYERKSGKDRDGDGALNDDYYGFLYGAHQVGTAAVIIENGFHDHVKTAKWLMDDGNLRRLAKAHAEVIDGVLRDYFDKVKEEKCMLNTAKPGDKGENVKQLQRLLKVLGRYGGGIDGRYGPATKEAVKAFQRSVGLDADGVAGAKTVEVLSKVQIFKDVPTDAWYAGEITEAVALGLTEGVGGRKIEPERAMTRAEALALAVRVAKM
jgi:hypothetical protein